MHRPFRDHSESLYAGSPEAPRRVVYLHGYTGSPDEFRATADKLAAKLDAYVTAPLLPGHGTRIEDLLQVRYEDILGFAREHVKAAAAEGKPLGLIGHSFGGYLAAILAPEVKARAVILTVTPYILRWPLALWGSPLVARYRTVWDKKLSDVEFKERLGFFFYKQMPGIGLSYLKRGIREMRAALPKLDMPLMTLHTREDPLTFSDSGLAILRESGRHPDNKSIVLEHRNHGIFYAHGAEEVEDAIVGFFERELLK